MLKKRCPDSIGTGVRNESELVSGMKRNDCPEWAGIRNLIELQKILGHVSLLTTARYTHLTAATQNNSCHTINKIINGFDIGWGGIK